MVKSGWGVVRSFMWSVGLVGVNISNSHIVRGSAVYRLKEHRVIYFIGVLVCLRIRARGVFCAASRNEELRNQDQVFFLPSNKGPDLAKQWRSCFCATKSFRDLGGT